MRNAFVDALGELAERDERVMLLTGDLGFTVLESFAERYPARFLNVGVAEQNMVGVATGLAEAGYVPFVYSIATFASMRGYEFIRNGAVLHDLPVRVVGVGGGVDYGHNGVTHYALEDVAIMRAQPGLAVIAPADAQRARQALFATADLPGPAYFRIGKGAHPVPGATGGFELGRAETIDPGQDVALIALGSIAAEVIRTRDRLAERGIQASVTLVESVSPAPADDLAEALAGASLAVTVEAHYAAGGVGSLVAEVIAERGLPCRLLRRAVEDVPRGLTGQPAYLYDELGLSAAKVAEAVVRAVEPVGR